jgi:ArsR family transcriptional regulator, lead/cadmium/zinc/bismuth-responsive transcriptional repressor
MYNDYHSYCYNSESLSSSIKLSMTEQEYSDRSIEDTQIPSCDDRLVHLDNVRQVQLEIMPMDEAQRRAELFNVLADPNRLRLLSALATQELCVCDLAAGLKMGESAVSHQLRVLRSMRMVNYRKEGRNVYYSLTNSPAINLYRLLSAL